LSQRWDDAWCGESGVQADPDGGVSIHPTPEKCKPE